MGRYGCNDIIQLVIINQTMRLFIFRQYPEYSYLNGATIAPWNRLYLPSNGPSESGSAYLEVNTINSVKYPTYLTCLDVSLSLYPVKFRCCE